MAIDAATHDRLLAAVSHLPHVLANVLVSQAAGRLAETARRCAGSGRASATRRASPAPTRIWTDIYLANSEAIAEEIDAPFGAAGAASGELLGGRRRGRPGTSRAREDRRALLEADLAGGPVHELRLTVPNRPGIVAQVALALGKAGVNIVDLALAPAPTCARAR